MPQLFAYQAEVPLQVFLISNEIQCQMPKGVGEEVGLRGKMNLLPDRFRVQPALDEIVEVAVVADQFLRSLVTLAQCIARRKA